MTANHDTFPCEGGCVCGAIRYRLSEEPIELHACHCTDCQTITGSAFVLSMPVHRRSVELLRGEPSRGSFVTVSGIARTDQRCAQCGTRLWGERSSLPEVINLRPSTLDDRSWAVPTAHIWTASAQPWVAIPRDALRYERQPEDPKELVRAWRSMRATSQAPALTRG